MHLEEGEIRTYFKKDCFLYVNHRVMVLNYVCIDLEVLKHERKRSTQRLGRDTSKSQVL